MPERINRRDQIVESASQLFMKQGYTDTSVRQIAEQVGVTEAALYYHFKEGKRELLQEVITCNLPNLMRIVETCEGATSLHDLIVRFGQGMAQIRNSGPGHMRWIISEFHRMSDDERDLLKSQHLGLQRALAEQIDRFIDESDEASALAWVLFCAALGYGQLFRSLGLETVADISVEEFIETLATALAAGR